jgi:ABC-2 type transport system permease protein
MTPPSSAVPENFEALPVSPAGVSRTRPFYWSVRRELYEYRSIYLAPLAIGGVILLGFIFVLARLPHDMRTPIGMQMMMHNRDRIAQPFDFAAGLIMAAAFIVSVFYSVDALYGERRDRSILFWKSLPVSDLTTVLAKASIALLVLPVIAYAATVVVETIMLLLSSAVVAGNGLSVAEFWNRLQLFHTMVNLLYHLVTVHMLWYAPLYAWLLLISAWAKRVPFLWAVLPPFAIGIFEKMAFHTAYFAAFMQWRVSGGREALGNAQGNVLDPEMHLTPGPFLATPGLWIGLLFAAAFLIMAARIRRQRAPL